ncbi:MAG: hypothetical protein PWQ50_1266 [Methanolobus sp.]|nr:hypothetical protein [Methanolobus sp.]
MIRGFIDDENAVSISVGFILTFTISVLMIVMVLSSFYSLMNDAEQTVMHDEFEIHGNDIAVRILPETLYSFLIKESEHR